MLNVSKIKHLKPTSKEAYLYRRVYDSFYLRDNKIPYINKYWLPSWSDAIDPSATVLDIHAKRFAL
jgi:hypothetical protein